MDTDSACEAYDKIIEELAAAKTSGMSEDVITYVISLMSDYVHCIKSLQEMCRLALWKAVSRKLISLKQLNMPTAFVASIKELFTLDI